LTKALFIADIHGNIHALQAIWEKEKDSDIIYCAGDLADPNPKLYSKQVIDWVRNKNVVCVKGNHDESFIAKYNSNDRQWREKYAAGVTEDDIEFLDNLPLTINFELDLISYCMLHKYDGDHSQRSYASLNSAYFFDKLWSATQSDSTIRHQQKRFVFGHTHLAAVHYLANDKLWFNPGSCHFRANKNNTIDRFCPEKSYEPYEPDKQAHYITVTNGCFSLNSVNYDHSAYAEHILGKEFTEEGFDLVTS